ncbi:hypothetical protein [Defluviimonas sp. SAOS-178_SWC]|uniref:hypothetical protein n=1 Tax=Defluviimonas sp. SAOS-178_SWC TaxID=3121287 RepID=UPI00322150F3
MQIKRRAITVGTTFFLAAATGHVMQNGDTISARLRGGDTPEQPVLARVEATAAVLAPAPNAAPAVTDPDPAVASPPIIAAAPAAVPEPETPDAIVEVAALRSVPGLPDLPSAEPKPLVAGTLLAARVEGLDRGYVRPKTAADATYSVFGIACADNRLSLDTSARAMLRVTLSAPCFPNERVVISHSGLIFATATDKAGDLDLMLPALAAEARVDLHIGADEVMSATHEVMGLDALNRVAIQWQGVEGFHLSAFENGAAFGMPGHVSDSQPRDRATSDGGFLTLLGDPSVDHPMLAEVYTAPVATRVDDIVVEAEVSAATCGRALDGEALRMAAGSPAEIEPLSFEMPGCDAVGDFLMLSLGPVADLPVAVAQGGK